MALNKHVQKLADKAELIIEHPAQLDKFAELLVLEAAQVIDTLVTYRVPASEYPELLKLHFFGVKDE